jgi:hypothetical protein
MTKFWLFLSLSLSVLASEKLLAQIEVEKNVEALFQALNPELLKTLEDLSSKRKALKKLKAKPQMTDAELSQMRKLRVSYDQIIENISKFPFKDLYQLQQSLQPLVGYHFPTVASLQIERQNLENIKKENFVGSVKEKKAFEQQIKTHEQYLKEQEFQVYADVDVINQLQAELPMMLRVAARRPETPSSPRASKNDQQSHEDSGRTHYPVFRFKRNKAPGMIRPSDGKLI